MTIGERIQTMKQNFNVRHGIEPKTISSAAVPKVILPRRKAPIKEGSSMWKNLPLITGSSLDGTEIPASPKKKPCESWKLNKRLNMPYTITEKCNGCGACARICPSGAISGEKKKLHAIDGALCIDCGACGRICPQSALLDAGGSECLMIKRSEWLKPDFILETCMACSICVDACPRVVWPCRICRGKRVWMPGPI